MKRFEAEVDLPVDSTRAETVEKAKREIESFKKIIETRVSKEIAQSFADSMMSKIDVFRDSLTQDPPSKFKYDIELKSNDFEFKFPGIRYNTEQREEMNRQISKYVSCGMLKEVAPSHKASPILLIPKSDGSYRMVVNFKRANTVVKKQSTCAIHIDSVRECLAGSKWYASFDLTNAFWQLQAGPVSTDHYRIRSHNKEYISPRVLQGTSNGGVACQHASIQLAGKYYMQKGNGILSYMDDILLYATSPGTSIGTHSIFSESAS